MAAAKELPFTKEEVKRAFKLLAGEDDPEGCITPEILEKSLVSETWAVGRTIPRHHPRGMHHPQDPRELIGECDMVWGRPLINIRGLCFENSIDRPLLDCTSEG